jgi:NADH/NAD ratio-sensing transcriptional regulator Rex
MQAGLFAYLRRQDAVANMKAWKEHLPSLEIISDVEIESCQKRKNLAFYSKHKHQGYGIQIQVWHLCVCLMFEPKDKSGRTAKKYL